MPHKTSSPPFRRAARFVGLALVAASSCFPFPAAQAKTPVWPVNIVLVHGIYDEGAVFRPMVRTLEAQGYHCFAPSLTPNDCSTGVRALSLQLARAIDTRFGKSAPLILVGFSMGGLITRDYVQNLPAHGRVRGVFLISPPNHGTVWATLARSGTKDLGTNSRFIQTLNGNLQAWQHIPVCTYWTPFDLMIVPATSSVWPVGDSKTIICLLHPWMVRDRGLTVDVVARLARLTAGQRPL